MSEFFNAFEAFLSGDQGSQNGSASSQSGHQSPSSAENNGGKVDSGPPLPTGREQTEGDQLDDVLFNILEVVKPSTTSSSVGRGTTPVNEGKSTTASSSGENFAGKKLVERGAASSVPSHTSSPISNTVPYNQHQRPDFPYGNMSQHNLSSGNVAKPDTLPPQTKLKSESANNADFTAGSQKINEEKKESGPFGSQNNVTEQKKQLVIPKHMDLFVQGFVDETVTDEDDEDEDIASPQDVDKSDTQAKDLGEMEVFFSNNAESETSKSFKKADAETSAERQGISTEPVGFDLLLQDLDPQGTALDISSDDAGGINIKNETTDTKPPTNVIKSEVSLKTEPSTTMVNMKPEMAVKPAVRDKPEPIPVKTETVSAVVKLPKSDILAKSDNTSKPVLTVKPLVITKTQINASSTTTSVPEKKPLVTTIKKTPTITTGSVGVKSPGLKQSPTPKSKGMSPTAGVSTIPLADECLDAEEEIPAVPCLPTKARLLQYPTVPQQRRPGSETPPPPIPHIPIKPVKGKVFPPTYPPPDRPGRTTNQLLYIKRTVMTAVWNHKYSWPFKRPVDAEKLKLPDYHTLIKQPMDLGTIKKRLNNTYYWCADECKKDFDLVFFNCFLYNKPDQDIVLMGRTLEKIYHNKLQDMPHRENEMSVKSRVYGQSVVDAASRRGGGAARRPYGAGGGVKRPYSLPSAAASVADKRLKSTDSEINGPGMRESSSSESESESGMETESEEETEDEEDEDEQHHHLMSHSMMKDKGRMVGGGGRMVTGLAPGARPGGHAPGSRPGLGPRTASGPGVRPGGLAPGSGPRPVPGPAPGSGHVPRPGSVPGPGSVSGPRPVSGSGPGPRPVSATQTQHQREGIGSTMSGNKPAGGAQLQTSKKTVKHYCKYCEQPFTSKYVRDVHEKQKHVLNKSFPAQPAQPGVKTTSSSDVMNKPSVISTSADSSKLVTSASAADKEPGKSLGVITSAGGGGPLARQGAQQVMYNPDQFLGKKQQAMHQQAQRNGGNKSRKLSKDTEESGFSGAKIESGLEPGLAKQSPDSGYISSHGVGSIDSPGVLEGKETLHGSTGNDEEIDDTLSFLDTMQVPSSTQETGSGGTGAVRRASGGITAPGTSAIRHIGSGSIQSEGAAGLQQKRPGMTGVVQQSRSLGQFGGRGQLDSLGSRLNQPRLNPHELSDALQSQAAMQQSKQQQLRHLHRTPVTTSPHGSSLMAQAYQSRLAQQRKGTVEQTLVTSAAGRGQQLGNGAGRGQQQVATGGRVQQLGAAAGGRGQQLGAAAGGRGQQLGTVAGGRGQQLGTAAGGRGQQFGAAGGRGQPFGATTGRVQQITAAGRGQQQLQREQGVTRSFYEETLTASSLQQSASSQPGQLQFQMAGQSTQPQISNRGTVDTLSSHQLARVSSPGTNMLSADLQQQLEGVSRGAHNPSSAGYNSQGMKTVQLVAHQSPVEVGYARSPAEGVVKHTSVSGQQFAMYGSPAQGGMSGVGTPRPVSLESRSPDLVPSSSRGQQRPIMQHSQTSQSLPSISSLGTSMANSMTSLASPMTSQVADKKPKPELDVLAQTLKLSDLDFGDFQDDLDQNVSVQPQTQELKLEVLKEENVPITVINTGLGVELKSDGEDLRDLLDYSYHHELTNNANSVYSGVDASLLSNQLNPSSILANSVQPQPVEFNILQKSPTQFNIVQKSSADLKLGSQTGTVVSGGSQSVEFNVLQKGSGVEYNVLPLDPGFTVPAGLDFETGFTVNQPQSSKQDPNKPWW